MSPHAGRLSVRLAERRGRPHCHAGRRTEDGARRRPGCATAPPRPRHPRHPHVHPQCHVPGGAPASPASSASSARTTTDLGAEPDRSRVSRLSPTPSPAGLGFRGLRGHARHPSSSRRARDSAADTLDACAQPLFTTQDHRDEAPPARIDQDQDGSALQRGGEPTGDGGDGRRVRLPRPRCAEHPVNRNGWHGAWGRRYRDADRRRRRRFFSAQMTRFSVQIVRHGHSRAPRGSLGCGPATACASTSRTPHAGRSADPPYVEPEAHEAQDHHGPERARRRTCRSASLRISNVSRVTRYPVSQESAPRGRTRARAIVPGPARSYLRRPLRYDRAEKRTTARLRVRPRSLPYDRASPDAVARAAGMPPTGDERAPVPLPRGASPAHRGRGRGARRTRKAKSEQGAPRRSVRARDQVSTRSRTDLDAENAPLGRRAGPERAGSVATG